MDNIQSIVITFLGAIGGFLVARSTAGKMQAESHAISTRAFTDLADQVQKLINDNALLNERINTMQAAINAKDDIIAEQGREIDRQQKEINKLRRELDALRNMKINE